MLYLPVEVGLDSQNFTYYTVYSTCLLKPSVDSVDLSSALFGAETEVNYVYLTFDTSVLT